MKSNQKNLNIKSRETNWKSTCVVRRENGSLKVCHAGPGLLKVRILNIQDLRQFQPGYTKKKIYLFETKQNNNITQLWIYLCSICIRL